MSQSIYLSPKTLLYSKLIDNQTMFFNLLGYAAQVFERISLTSAHQGVKRQKTNTVLDTSWDALRFCGTLERISRHT
jgi:hypothetical protein